MPPTPRRRILAIEQLNTEWRTLGRSEGAVRALRLLADRDPALARLAQGSTPADGRSEGALPVCRNLWDLVEHMRQAAGTRGREEAARMIRVMLRESQLDPLIARCLIQALLPGLLTVAKRLRWGQGGEWEDGSEFFSEALSTTWTVLFEWSGQDRPYAVLDLLSAIRCRMRRQLFRARDLQQQQVQMTLGLNEPRAVHAETDLEVLARTLIDLRHDGMRAEDVEVLYAHHVMGFSIAELASVTGRDRRSLYARRDRGRRRLCA
jgi:DNA-directed RNA polymerase specialized sigma24 family protein